MRINTDGNQAYRRDLFERTADQLDEATTTGGIEAACIHTQAEGANKREAMDYLRERLNAGNFEEVAAIFSTEQVPVEVEVEYEIN